jgi:hypothetical protein
MFRALVLFELGVSSYEVNVKSIHGWKPRDLECTWREGWPWD